MAVGFQVKYYWYQIGTASFLHAFFSTVCYHLENQIWGSQFPYIMTQLYSGELASKDIDNAKGELTDIKVKLSDINPEKVVWDIDNLELTPPWGSEISSDINSLGNYFVTSDGEDFLTIFMHALEKAKKLNVSLKII